MSLRCSQREGHSRSNYVLYKAPIYIAADSVLIYKGFKAVRKSGEKDYELVLKYKLSWTLIRPF